MARYSTVFAYIIHVTLYTLYTWSTFHPFLIELQYCTCYILCVPEWVQLGLFTVGILTLQYTPGVYNRSYIKISSAYSAVPDLLLCIVQYSAIFCSLFYCVLSNQKDCLQVRKRFFKFISIKKYGLSLSSTYTIWKNWETNLKVFENKLYKTKNMKKVTLMWLFLSFLFRLIG